VERLQGDIVTLEATNEGLGKDARRLRKEVKRWMAASKRLDKQAEVEAENTNLKVEIEQWRWMVRGITASPLDTERIEKAKELLDTLQDGVRDEIMHFAVVMERKMRKHDPDEAEGNFTEGKDCTPALLWQRLCEEANELRDSLFGDKWPFFEGDPEAVVSECADVANFAMMLASNVQQEDKTHDGQGGQ
jgi:hypothetical protein